MDVLKRTGVTVEAGLREPQSLSRIEPMRAGTAFGGLIGATHLGWAILVAGGWAQPLMSFLFRLHFIQPIYVIRPFDFGTAALLVVLASAGGFVSGYAFALLWNLLVKNTKQ